MMIRTYFRTAWRHLLTGKIHASINVAGLAIGMTVALLIGLWVSEELSFDHYHRNYRRLAQVMDVENINGTRNTSDAIAIPLAEALRSHYADAFARTALVYPNFIHSLAAGDKKISASGVWAQPDLPDMLTLKMIAGRRNALKDLSSVLITRSLSLALFGRSDPMNQSIRVDNLTSMNVAGVFEDLPQNTRFYGTQLILPWDRAMAVLPGLSDFQRDWGTRYWWLFVEIKDHIDMDTIGNRIKDLVGSYVQQSRESLLLHPMSKWHLYSEFRNGKITGGRIRVVRLFGLIGVFVLLLACINFMNLSTARSARRSKEVGIRKAIGSLRRQLIGQFLSESLLVTGLAGILAFGMTLIFLPSFNRLTDRQISIPFWQPSFWMLILGFTIVTGLVAGSYPAFYLSGFRPVQVLRGSITVGHHASLPRKSLMVIQFTASIILLIGTLIVYRQIQYARDRPVGYTREGLITVNMNSMDIINAPYNALRNELIRTGFIMDMAKSSGRTTDASGTRSDLNWTGKDPNVVTQLGIIGVTHDFGNTIGWTLLQGRDFTRNFPTDSGAVILNEAAVKITGLRHPVGEPIFFDGQRHLITGVVRDMVMASPYAAVQPAVFYLAYDWARSAMTIRIRPGISLRKALSAIGSVCNKYNPGAVFDYQFTSEEYASKFSDEERVGRLALLSTVLAIFISCLGLFGLAGFVAEQRRKEIGVRKVLGASAPHLCRLLTQEFIVLTLLSAVIATPIAWYLLHRWLQQYEYRTAIAWWIFPATTMGTVIITLLSVSYQFVRTASANPVDSLRES